MSCLVAEGSGRSPIFIFWPKALYRLIAWDWPHTGLFGKEPQLHQSAPRRSAGCRFQSRLLPRAWRTLTACCAVWEGVSAAQTSASVISWLSIPVKATAARMAEADCMLGGSSAGSRYLSRRLPRAWQKLAAWWAGWRRAAEQFRGDRGRDRRRHQRCAGPAACGRGVCHERWSASLPAQPIMAPDHVFNICHKHMYTRAVSGASYHMYT